MNKGSGKRISKGTILGYGVSGVGNTIGGDLFYTWFLFFLTSVAGIPPAAAGTVSLVAVLWLSLIHILILAIVVCKASAESVGSNFCPTIS